ncbi:OCIA domain-containing protein 2 [Aulostomus maculatus]
MSTESFLEMLGEPPAAPGSAPATEEEKFVVDEERRRREQVADLWTECHHDSTLYRAFPMSFGSMVIASALIKNGFLKSTKPHGTFPKVAAAGILGYILGKVSYIGTCYDKFKDLEKAVGREAGHSSNLHVSED